MTPDFVVVGHVVQDLTAQGSRLGGAATFASLQARRLGKTAGVVTRAGIDILSDPQFSGIDFAGRSSQETTTFENRYDGAERRQRMPAQAALLTDEDVPSDWLNASVVFLAPVCNELAPEYSRLFAHSLLGIGAQGWLRDLDEEARVQRRVWTGAPFWEGGDVLFVSDEDLAGNERQLDRWVKDVPAVVVTRERRGARVHGDGAWREIDAFPATEVDPTGAGDVFAAAYLVRYEETDDVASAMRFASAAAAASVEAASMDGIADRDEIEKRLAAHPEIVLT